MPALPSPADSSSAWNEVFQPGLSAGMRKARGERLACVAGSIEQRVDLGHGHRLRPVGHLDDLVAGLDDALR